MNEGVNLRVSCVQPDGFSALLNLRGSVWEHSDSKDSVCVTELTVATTFSHY